MKKLISKLKSIIDDAERYRYLRSCIDKTVWDKLQNTYPFAEEHFDKVVDDAKKQCKLKYQK